MLVRFSAAANFLKWVSREVKLGMKCSAAHNGQNR